MSACPICSKPAADAKYTPFCSKRCADVDLSRWLKGSYAIPGQRAGDEGGGEELDGPESPENGHFPPPDKPMDSR